MTRDLKLVLYMHICSHESLKKKKTGQCWPDTACYAFVQGLIIQFLVVECLWNWFSLYLTCWILCSYKYVNVNKFAVNKTFWGVDLIAITQSLTGWQ